MFYIFNFINLKMDIFFSESVYVFILFMIFNIFLYFPENVCFIIT